MTERKDFAKIFSTYILTLILPIVVVGIIVLVILLGNVSERTESLNKKIIAQCVENIDSEISNVLRLSSGLIEDSEVSEFLLNKYSSKRDLNFNAWKAIGEISLSINNNSLFADIAVFSRKNECIVNSKSVFEMQEYYDTYVKNTKISSEEFYTALQSDNMSYFYLTRDGLSDSGENFIICRSIRYKNQYEGMILFVVDTEAFLSRILGNDKSSVLQFALISKDGKYVLNTEDCHREAINFGKEMKQNGIYSYSKNKVFVHKSNKNGDLYVFHITKGEYSGNTLNLSIIFLVLILVILFISIAAARRKITTIKDVFSDYSKRNLLLSDKLGEYISIAKKADMVRALQNHFDVWGNPIKYDFKLDRENSLVTVLNILNAPDSLQVSSELTNKVLSSACAEVKKELAQKDITCDYAPVSENFYVFVMNYDCISKKEMTGIFDSVMKSYNLQFCLGIGGETQEVSKLNQSYDEAFIALEYAIKEENENISDYINLSTKLPRKLRYSAEKEKNLLRAIKLGICDATEEIFDQIYEENYDEEEGYLPKRLIFSLIITLYSAVEEAYENNPEKILKYDKISKNVSGMQEIQAFDVLKELAVNIAKDNKQSTKQDLLSSKIVECIDRLYLAPDFSLQKLADELNLNYYYLSRVFVELFGVNFISFITAKRLDYAKELLVKTDSSVEKISSTVGFMNSSAFINVFKKNFGVTPGQYRKNNSK